MKSNARRWRERGWRSLLWVGALAAVTLAAWIATYATYDVMLG
ncbi:MAG TPA: hypothetical protein VG123_10070 [Streptosporangiaceae bacterium]|jgi:hypothetical protein|nr:hypothetical protein [Streptosporangiaceae bacterium]